MRYQNFLLTTAALIAFTFVITKNTLAQDDAPVSFGKVTAADFILPESTVVDSNTNAVIVANTGSVEFVGNTDNDWVSYVYKTQIRIKIINSKGYDISTDKIYLFGEGDEQDKLDEFQATTYNLENGNVISTAFNKSDLFDQKIRKTLDEKKFTMPNVKAGSIIEYSYTIRSKHFYHVPVWNFQYLDYPCLYSQFKIGIPDLLRFVQIKFGIDSFSSVKSIDSFERLKMADVAVSTTVHNHEWTMKDIPAFQAEDFIGVPENFLDRVEFSLAQIYNGENVKNLNTDWTAVENRLLDSKYFGRAIGVETSSNLYNTMKKVCALDGDILAAAKQIYFYVRDNFKCTPDDDVFIDNDLYDVNKAHKGSVAELNMLLIALLRQRGVKADPVILATKSYGINPEKYPVLEKLNYVVCMMTYGANKIFLDASDPDMGFGKLPLECYNGHARIIDAQHSGPIFFYPSDIKEPNATSVLLVNNPSGSGESGSVQTTPGYFESTALRESITEEGGETKYLKKLRADYGPDLNLTNFHVDSLHKVEMPVSVNYDIDYKSGFDGDVIYFSPVVTATYKENPFKSEERRYPIEFPYPIDETYDLTMDIPNGFNVDELPKSVRANFNGTDGTFIYQIMKDAYTVQLHMQLKINRTVFAPEDYKSLRDFFAMVVKKQSEQVVFKKK